MTVLPPRRHTNASPTRLIASVIRSVAFVVLAASLGIAGCGSRAADEAQQSPDPEVAVRVAPLETASFEDRVEATGTWRGQSELVVAAPFAGVVEALTVRAGDRVRPGQVIGSLTTLESHATQQGASLMAREARDPAARSEAQRAQRLARRDHVRVPLVASQAGVVVRRSVEPGAQVLEAAELVAIVPWSSLVFEAHVPQSAQGRVRMGQRATILETGRPSRAATVQRLLPAVDPADQSTLAWLTPASGAPTPELDRFGTASIVVGTAHVALAVPDSAVVEDDLTGEARIAVVDSSRHAHWTTVTLGAAMNGRHELRTPALAPGTPVVVEGHHGLPDGVRVRWTP